MKHPRLALAVACSTLLALAAFRAPQDERVVLSSEHVSYEWKKGWGKLPDGMSFGNTHGCVVVDSKGRVYMNTDTENAVIVFEADGTFVKSWGKQLAGGLHGMCLVKEGDAEFLYLAHTGRHEVLKSTLDGEILLALSWPEEAKVYENAGQYAPTSVAVAADGTLYVADGYGRSYIHQYDRERKYARTFGGPGTELGQLRTPHGIWIDASGEEPVLLVADRENQRVQSFSLDGKPLGIVVNEVRRPCSVHQAGDRTVIADLAGRITVLDRKLKILGQLGDNPDPNRRAQNGVPRDQWKDGEFLSPHNAHLAPNGDLYVLDWNYLGRITKLVRLK